MFCFPPHCSPVSHNTSALGVQSDFKACYRHQPPLWLRPSVRQPLVCLFQRWLEAVEPNRRHKRQDNGCYFNQSRKLIAFKSILCNVNAARRPYKGMYTRSTRRPVQERRRQQDSDPNVDQNPATSHFFLSKPDLVRTFRLVQPSVAAADWWRSAEEMEGKFKKEMYQDFTSHIHTHTQSPPSCL